MHVFQRGALARRRITRVAATGFAVVLVASLAVVVAGILSSDGGPLLPSFVGALQQVVAPAVPLEGAPRGATPTAAPFRLPLPFFSSAPTAAATSNPPPQTSNTPAPSPRNTPNGPPTTPRGRTPSPRP
ncbi:MAG: hypothetical protein E6H81_06285 [Chloroflexi bacterium]|nr:MAG: hypothetical protein E6H81_06285 [Chloroflexota bacterium]